VLALTRCDQDTHGSATELLGTIIEENRRTPLVKVVGVDVHWAEKGCNHGDDLRRLCSARGEGPARGHPERRGFRLSIQGRPIAWEAIVGQGLEPRCWAAAASRREAVFIALAPLWQEEEVRLHALATRGRAWMTGNGGRGYVATWAGFLPLPGKNRCRVGIQSVRVGVSY
jgi:hypothetical protein